MIVTVGRNDLLLCEAILTFIIFFIADHSNISLAASVHVIKRTYSYSKNKQIELFASTTGGPS